MSNKASFAGYSFTDEDYSDVPVEEPSGFQGYSFVEEDEEYAEGVPVRENALHLF